MYMLLSKKSRRKSAKSPTRRNRQKAAPRTKITIDENLSPSQKYTKLKDLLDQYDIDVTVIDKLPETKVAKHAVENYDKMLNKHKDDKLGESLLKKPVIEDVVRENTFIGDGIKKVYKGIDKKVLTHYDKHYDTVYAELYDDLGSLINDSGFNGLLTLVERVSIYLCKIFIPAKWFKYVESFIQGLVKTIKVYLLYKKYHGKFRKNKQGQDNTATHNKQTSDVTTLTTTSN